MTGIDEEAPIAGAPPTARGSKSAPALPRIVFVITRANVGGAQKHLAWLIEGLGSRYDARVLVGEKGFLTDRLDALGVPFEHLRSLRRRPSPLGDFGTILALRTAIRRLAPDIVHLHSFKAAMLGRIAAIGLPVQVFVTAHGWSFTDDNPLLRRVVGRWIEKRLGPVTDRLIVVCRRDLETALRHRLVDVNRVRLIHNGVPDAGHGEASRRRDSERISLVCVGRICPQKNQAALLEVVRELPDVELLLIGDGPDRAMVEQRIASGGLADRVKLDTDNIDPARQLRRADVYVSCSRWEGLPLSVIEALRAGLPVVATDVGGMNELVNDGVNGFLHTAGDEGAIRSSLARLAADPMLRETMGEASRRLYEASFGAEQFVAATAALYDESLASPG